MMAVLDPEQLQGMSIQQIRSRITELGADWNPAEKKVDLTVRLAQLEGAPDVAERIKKQMAEAGFAKENKPVYQPTRRLERDEIKKLLQPYTDQGLEYKISPDGRNWAMRVDTGRTSPSGHERVPVIVRDSGSTTIPPKVLVQCAQLLVASRRSTKASKIKADAEFVEASAEEA
jgi:hypothetical protein